MAAGRNRARILARRQNQPARGRFHPLQGTLAPEGWNKPPACRGVRSRRRKEADRQVSADDSPVNERLCSVRKRRWRAALQNLAAFRESSMEAKLLKCGATAPLSIATRSNHNDHCSAQNG